MSLSNKRQVVISGGSGLIGSALIASLIVDGYSVTQLVREYTLHHRSASRRPSDDRDPEQRDSQESRSSASQSTSSERREVRLVTWRPGDALDPDLVAHACTVVCLNGAPISRLPWTGSYRSTLHDSRIFPAHTLATALTTAMSETPGTADPPLFICASAIGYYGSQPGVVLDESGSAGHTFLAELCRDWEYAARGAEPVVPTALLRSASMLHPSALLKPLIPLARCALAGRIGTGRQIWPWITLEDEVRAIRHVMDERLTGPINLVSPHESSELDIVCALARRLRRPCWLPTPASFVRLAIGKDATASLITADAHAVPGRLTASGFTFRYAELDEAMAQAMA